MKVKLTLCLYLFFTIGLASAQTFSLSGRIVDSTSQKGLDFITVALKQATGQPVKTILSSSNGAFKFEKIAGGNFKLAIVAVGYSRKELNVKVDQNVDLGAIEIQGVSTTLKEVLVMADKPLIRQEVDRIAYDVQADPESKVNTVLDMMRKVPLLSVDADDNIKLKGSGSYKILINGRPSSMMARDPKEVLKSMSASNIQKIEVITTPPAKYDSEGLAGLINIITNKKVDAGYNASLNARGTFPSGGPGGSGSLTLKEGRFGVSGWGGVNTFNNPGSENSSNRTTTGAFPTVLFQDGRNESDNVYNHFSSEISFEIDSLNLITGEVGVNGGVGASTSNQLSRLLNSSTNALSQGYRLQNQSENSWAGMDAGINYQLGFKRNKNQFLTLSYKYNGQRAV